MTGSLQIKSNKYYVVVRYKNKYGKIVQKWINTNIQAKGGKTEATKKMKEILKDLEEEQPEEEYDFKNLKFLELLKLWIPLKKEQVTPTTYLSYQRQYIYIEKYFKPMNLYLKDLKPYHIEGFYKSLYQKNLSSNSVLHYHTMIRQALKYAVWNDMILSNPCDKIKRPRHEGYKASFYSIEEMEKLFDCIKDNEYKLPIMLSAMYGFRRSEVLGLRWQSIDFENKTIRVEHKIIETQIDGQPTLIMTDKLKTKTSNRILPLLPQAEQLLKEQLQNIEQNKILMGLCYEQKFNDYVCVDNCGHLMLPNRITHNFNKILKRNNLRHIRFHDLRHSCASIMLKNRVPMKQIQEWLGHADFGTTANIYSHLDYSSKIDSANTISNVFNFAKKEQEKISFKEEIDKEIEQLEKMIEEKKKQKESQQFNKKSDIEM